MKNRLIKLIITVLTITTLQQGNIYARQPAVDILRPVAAAERPAGPVQTKVILDKKFKFSPDFKNRHNELIRIMDEIARALGRLNVKWVRVATNGRLSHSHGIPKIDMVDVRFPQHGFGAWWSGYMLSVNELVYNAIDAVAMRWFDDGSPPRYRGIIGVNIRRVGDDLRIEIDDNGNGFTKAELESLFRMRNIQSKKKTAKYADLRLIGFAGQGTSKFYGNGLIISLGGKIEIDTFRPDSGAYNLTFLSSSQIAIDRGDRRIRGSTITFTFPGIFGKTIVNMPQEAAPPQDLQTAREAERAVLRPLAHDEKLIESKTANWRAIAQIFGLDTDNREVVLSRVAALSLFLYETDERGRERVFQFRDAERILTDEQLRALSDELKKGNRAAYEALFFAYYNYVEVWSQAPRVTSTPDERNPGKYTHLNSEDLFDRGLTTLRTICESFDRDRGGFYNYLNNSLKLTKQKAVKTARVRRRAEETAGYRYGPEARREIPEDKIDLLKANVTRGREVIHAIFTDMRLSIYRDAYEKARVVSRYSPAKAVDSANYAVGAGGVSYGDEYVICEYLFGGELPQNPKEYEQIGREGGGIPIVKQTGEDGRLGEDTGIRKSMGRAGVALRFSKAKAPLLSYLAARGINVPAEGMAEQIRINLIKAIVRNADEILDKLANGANPMSPETTVDRINAETIMQNVLRPLATGEKDESAQQAQPSLTDYGVAWARVPDGASRYALVHIEEMALKSLPWEGVAVDARYKVPKHLVYGRLQESIFSVLNIKTEMRTLTAEEADRRLDLMDNFFTEEGLVMTVEERPIRFRDILLLGNAREEFRPRILRSGDYEFVSFQAKTMRGRPSNRYFFTLAMNGQVICEGTFHVKITSSDITRITGETVEEFMFYLSPRYNIKGREALQMILASIYNFRGRNVARILTIPGERYAELNILQFTRMLKRHTWSFFVSWGFRPAADLSTNRDLITIPEAIDIARRRPLADERMREEANKILSRGALVIHLPVSRLAGPLETDKQEPDLAYTQI